MGTAMLLFLGGCGAEPVARLDSTRPDPQGTPRPVLTSRNHVEQPLKTLPLPAESRR
jgi:hypothetical protein